MRLVVAGAMFTYGINKVFGLQFPEPGMQRLLQDYGDSSPMGLLWTFMGASQPYTMFAGWMETIGGLLLCLRRTQLVGTLSFTRDCEKTLRLAGEVAGARIEAVCERLEAKSFLLMNRGFHWVNETPFNR